MRRLFNRYRLWRWDQNEGRVLALAETRQTLAMGHGRRSWLLDHVIDTLRAERAELARKAGD